MRLIAGLASVMSLLPAAAFAEGGEHPYFKPSAGPRTVDLGAAPETSAAELTAMPVGDERPPAELPAGLVQAGSMVVPQQVADGIAVDPGTIHAVEDIPGNKYPRKHTVFINFDGGMLYSGGDNSAESRSALARQGVYPAFPSDEGTRASIVQLMRADLAGYGVRVVYGAENRPSKTVPYTMAMVGGSWTDTNLDEPAGGVAPGADCGALGQRHVVYTFGNSGASRLASTTAQEVGHAWGLDHTVNCSSVMSYCGGGDKIFSSSCDALCEEQCQGPAGCRLTHEQFCGVGNDRQNEAATLAWLFGTDEPDIEAPYVEIVSPVDGTEYEDGDDVNLRAIVDDNFGGFGWKFTIEKDGEVVYDEVDYDKDVDDELRAALNLVNLDPGVYTMTVEAEDQADQISSDTVTITVLESVGGGADGGAGDGGSGGQSEGDEGGGEADGGADGDSSGGGEPGAVDDDGDGGTGEIDSGTTGGGGAGVDDSDGSGCSVSGSGRGPTHGLAFAGLLVAGLVGRRRLNTRRAASPAARP